jgi:hypothetical protein
VTDGSIGVFLMTDIVGSTLLWAEHPDAMGPDLAVHDDVLSDAIVEHGGVIISAGPTKGGHASVTSRSGGI